MTDRPCRTDRDLRRLFALMLPGMTVPACGTADADAKARADAQAKGEDDTPRERLLGRRE